MREIKFRAWDKEYNFMIEPDDIAPFNYELITGNGRVMEIEERHSYMGTETNFNDISDKRILMQFTGLVDKNGKEIYESDLVKGINRITEGEMLQKVTFLNGCFMFGNWNAHEYFNKHKHNEVIGNIYEHPHLLEECRVIRCTLP